MKKSRRVEKKNRKSMNDDGKVGKVRIRDVKGQRTGWREKCAECSVHCAA